VADYGALFSQKWGDENRVVLDQRAFNEKTAPILPGAVSGGAGCEN